MNARALLTQKTYLCESGRPLSRPFILRKVIFVPAFLAKLVRLSGGTTFPVTLPPPPPSVEGGRAPGVSSPTPGEHTDRVLFDPFLRWGSGSECAFASAPFCLPRVPFSGGRAQRVSRRVEQESTRSGVVVFWFFFFPSPPPEVRGFC